MKKFLIIALFTSASLFAANNRQQAISRQQEHDAIKAGIKRICQDLDKWAEVYCGADKLVYDHIHSSDPGRNIMWHEATKMRRKAELELNAVKRELSLFLRSKL